MRGRVRLLGAAVIGILALLAPPAAAQDDVFMQNDYGGFINILPGGQGETVNAAEFAQAEASGSPPASFTNQLEHYADLVKHAPTLTRQDLDHLFKPASFGVRTPNVSGGVTPRPGVLIVRDNPYGVPHVYGETRPDTFFGAGYANAQDRLFLMDVLRHTGRARLSELAGPGDGDANLRMDAEQLKIADYSEEELQRMLDEGERTAGPEGTQVRRDLDAYVAGVNKYIAEARSDASKLPVEYPALGRSPEDWKPTDTVAVASLIGGIFGRGGGGEVNASQVLQAARSRFGRRGAESVFRDFRREDDPEAPVTTTRRFKFDNPGRPRSRAIALPDLGSVRERDPIISGSTAEEEDGGGGGGLPIVPLGGLSLPRQQSNALLIRRQDSSFGRPVAVMGPQVGYFSPQILMEMDMHGPGIDVRGATFPGIGLYVLLGRGQDFAWSATTATTDVVDEFVERLCEPGGGRPTLQSNHYLYKGRCRPLVEREHVIQTPTAPSDPSTPSRTIRMKVERSVHGPIQARATVGGRPVAIAEARSTYFHELDSAIAFKRLNGNEIRNAREFQRTMNRVNFAFNWFYVDDRDIAWLQSGWYPKRRRGVHPSLPAWGTGAYDWRGFRESGYSSQRMSYGSLPKDMNPKRGYLVNWNNKQAPGWRSADDVWTYSSVHRSERLEKPVRRAIAGAGKLTLTELTQIMALGATIDLRGQEIYPLLRRVIGRNVDAETAPLVALLDTWEHAGAHRRDVDGDNVLDDSAAVALMDAWWTPLVRGIFEPKLGRALVDRIAAVAGFHQPPGPGGSAFFDGWWGYVDKDLRRLLGDRVRGRLSRRYCGRGSRAKCRAVLIGTLKAAARQVAARFGSSNQADWKVPATCPEGRRPPACDQIEFTTAGAVATHAIPWQDRPTFQQLVEVQGHRPR
jgi:acyl-homoserine lactone acylase PvdQ